MVNYPQDIEYWISLAPSHSESNLHKYFLIAGKTEKYQNLLSLLTELHPLPSHLFYITSSIFPPPSTLFTPQILHKMTSGSASPHSIPRTFPRSSCLGL